MQLVRAALTVVEAWMGADQKGTVRSSAPLNRQRHQAHGGAGVEGTSRAKYVAVDSLPASNDSPSISRYLGVGFPWKFHILVHPLKLLPKLRLV